MYVLDSPQGQQDVFWVTLFSHVGAGNYGFSVRDKAIVTSCEHDFPSLYGESGMLKRVVEILPSDYRHIRPSRFVGTGEEFVPKDIGLERVWRLNPEEFMDALDELAERMHL
jgi:hypothetical protein